MEKSPTTTPETPVTPTPVAATAPKKSRIWLIIALVVGIVVVICVLVFGLSSLGIASFYQYIFTKGEVIDTDTDINEEETDDEEEIAADQKLIFYTYELLRMDEEGRNREHTFKYYSLDLEDNSITEILKFDEAKNQYSTGRKVNDSLVGVLDYKVDNDYLYADVEGKEVVYPLAEKLSNIPYVAYSPSGKYVAYQDDSVTPPGEVVIVDTETLEEYPVDFENENEYVGQFLDDNHLVVWFGDAGYISYSVVKFDIRTGKGEKLYSNGYSFTEGFSEYIFDPNYILKYTYKVEGDLDDITAKAIGPSKLFLKNIKSKTETEIYSTDEAMDSLSISPDGKSFVIVLDDHKKVILGKIDRTDGIKVNVEEISAVTPERYMTVWTTDSRKLVFVSQPDYNSTQKIQTISFYTLDIEAQEITKIHDMSMHITNSSMNLVGVFKGK